MSNYHYYRKLGVNEADAGMHDRAEKVVTFVATRLEIPAPAVIWLVPALPSEATGVLGSRPACYHDQKNPQFLRSREKIDAGYTTKWQDIYEIWIRSNLCGCPDLEFVAAHEVRHIWQRFHHPDIFNEEDKAEGDAYAYAFDALRNYLNTNIAKMEEARRFWFFRQVAERSI